MKGVIIAGTSSGVGKTVATLVVLRALAGIGEDPQPAKLGPDFIDPSHHRAVTGKPSRTLDIWLEGRSGVKANYDRGEGSICVAEGVMGLYDGDSTSTAEVAELLGLPVILVVDGSAGKESVAATALGFKEYADCRDLDVEIPGIISQRTRPGKHERGIEKALPEGLTYFGGIPPLSDLEIPERHLGLFMGEQVALSKDKLDRAGRGIDASLIAEAALEPESLEATPESPIDHREMKVGMAHDSAFNFIYPRTREKLAETDLVTFSPLDGDPVPDVDAIYLPGGYPELHSETLGESSTLDELAGKAKTGLPVFGECGGMMAMCESLTVGGKTHSMSGILPGEVEMVDSLQGLGYVELEGKEKTPLSSPGSRLRGHEFHYSRIKVGSDPSYAFKVLKGQGIDGEHEGLMRYNSLGTYTHFHGEGGAFDCFLSECDPD